MSFVDLVFQKDPKKFGKFRQLVIENVPIWLKELPNDSVAFFDECAHMGGALSYKNGFVCKSHGWTYSEFGENLTPKSPGLRRVEILAEDSSKIIFRLSRKKTFETEKLDSELKLSVLSHACLLFEYKSKRILFDPWLEGPTYYGSWFLEPDLGIHAEMLSVDAIVITHPHPDHFHLKTLDLMDKSTPIYFPGFPSKIIDNGLMTIGWENINAVPWRCEFEVSENVILQFLQPRSLWEDSATLLRAIKNKTVFTWLNLVDAGSVVDDFLIPELDLLSSAFDQGASGYPLTWTQISEKNQISILEEQRAQNLLNLPTKTRQLRARNFLPFAGHWKLGLNEHKKFAELIPHTSFDQLNESFNRIAPDSKFLKLMPGMSYEFQSGLISNFIDQKNPHRKSESYELEFMGTLVSESDLESFASLMKELIDYSKIFDSENVEFCVEVEEIGFKETYIFGDVGVESIKIDVAISARIFLLLAKRIANWDHVSIGYWGSWRRNPNRYPANFMRLLQVGRPERYASLIENENQIGNQLLEMTMAELIEKNPKELIQLFTRAGLPCGACNLVNTETLAQALRIHRVDLASKPWFIRELAAAWSYQAYS
jgi:hypothetical protein